MSRTIVFGLGAIGGVIAARLVQANRSVVGIARGAHGEAVRDHGLTLETPEGSSRVDLRVVDHPSRLTIGLDDVVVLAVKSQQTDVAVDALRTSAPASTPVVCAQNGVENERRCLRSFERVYGVTVMCPAVHLSPGVVQAYSSPIPGLLDIGLAPSGLDDVALHVRDEFVAAGFDSIARDDIMRWKYAKLLMNLGNAVEAVCGPDARSGPIMGLLRAEGAACLAAAGIDVASEQEDATRRGDLLQLHPINGERRRGGSTWQSVQRGTGDVETDFLNGEIVMLGRLHGVPTPANALLQRHAREVAVNGLPPGSIPEEQLLAEWRLVTQ
ncbi:MAG TPA: 2-dehydropantoate 2-reductase N-terminal domain-containing protein [Ilumatobacteraceae bacterium]|nr:2-dehydropantoate 2-reductase N-terminal domain-containing protein [Ilumatobacteraceae bacterium]